MTRGAAAALIAVTWWAPSAWAEVAQRVVPVAPERLWRAIEAQPEIDRRSVDARRYTARAQLRDGAASWQVDVDWDEVSGGARLRYEPAGPQAAAWAERVVAQAGSLPQSNQFCRGASPDLSIPEPSVEAATSCGYGNFSSAVHELEKCGDHETTLRLLAACVKEGHAAGLLRIAQLYETGVGLPQRPERMAEFMARAAGSEPAAYGRTAKVQYATAKYFGVGVPVDRDAALTMFREAAAEGDVDANQFLAEGWHAAWRRADGSLFRDPDFGRHQTAAAESDLSYRNQIDSPRRFKCLYGYVADKTGDHASAIRIFEDCIARWNDVYSMIWLAQIHESGVGVPQNLPRAAALMKRGAETGGDDPYAALARYHWGRALAEGRGVPRDLEAGRRWLARAGDEGVPEARALLASLPVAH